MKKICLSLCCSMFAIACYCQQDVLLSYDKPASIWTEALPVGNGRLGAMIFGGIEDELIQLNESTLWSGGPVKKNLNDSIWIPGKSEGSFVQR